MVGVVGVAGWLTGRATTSLTVGGWTARPAGALGSSSAGTTCNHHPSAAVLEGLTHRSGLPACLCLLVVSGHASRATPRTWRASERPSGPRHRGWAGPHPKPSNSIHTGPTDRLTDGLTAS